MTAQFPTQANRLLRCQLGLRPLDDRDSYSNKRLETPGVLLANLFRQYYGKVIKDMRTLLTKVSFLRSLSSLENSTKGPARPAGSLSKYASGRETDRPSGPI